MSEVELFSSPWVAGTRGAGEPRAEPSVVAMREAETMQARPELH